jgi:hypothetical protein
MTSRVGSRVIRCDEDNRGHRSDCEADWLTGQTALLDQGSPHGSFKGAKAWGALDVKSQAQLPSPRRTSPVAAGFAPQSGAALGPSQKDVGEVPLLRNGPLADDRTICARAEFSLGTCPSAAMTCSAVLR